MGTTALRVSINAADVEQEVRLPPHLFRVQARVLELEGNAGAARVSFEQGVVADFRGGFEISRQGYDSGRLDSLTTALYVAGSERGIIVLITCHAADSLENSAWGIDHADSFG